MHDISPSVFIAKGARIEGKTSIGEGSSVWFNAVLRGDAEGIKIGRNTSIQDCVVVHSEEGRPVSVGDNVTVGHGAVLHGCTIKDHCTIGMNSTVLDEAVVGENSIIGANALVVGGKEYPPNSLIMGVPAKVVREITEEERIKLEENAKHYVKLAKEYAAKKG
ncbi:gamma carbonic anhydrase family protein [Candidatus Altiarchaeota archaeon]